MVSYEFRMLNLAYIMLSGHHLGYQKVGLALNYFKSEPMTLSL